MINARIFNDLCRHPQWQLNDIKITPSYVNITGWALPFHNENDAGQILLNGVKASNLSWANSPAIKSIFPYLRNADWCNFAADFKAARLANILHFSYVGAYSNDPFDRWTDIYFPLSLWRERKFFAPDVERMRRAHREANLFRYVSNGFTIAAQLEQALQTYFGTHLRDYSRICDWGVGCGRVAQMVHYIAPESDLIGLDFVSDNASWCTNNLPFGRYEATGLYPPTSLQPESIDLLYGISVFTHLNREAFSAWIEELARVLRRGGVAMVTINGGAGLVRQAGTNYGLVARVLQNGFDDTTRDASLAAVIGDPHFYRTTFVTEASAVAMFSKHFRIRDVLKQTKESSEDLIVCEKI